MSEAPPSYDDPDFVRGRLLAHDGQLEDLARDVGNLQDERRRWLGEILLLRGEQRSASKAQRAVRDELVGHFRSLRDDVRELARVVGELRASTPEGETTQVRHLRETMRVQSDEHARRLRRVKAYAVAIGAGLGAGAYGVAKLIEVLGQAGGH